MSYTWQDVKLNIDTKAEAYQEKKDQERIQGIASEEANAASIWGLGLGALGVFLGFGPAGFYAGKEIGKWGADMAYDWESQRIDPGKFNIEEAEEFNETLKHAAEDTDFAQVISSITNLASWYIKSGGLTAAEGEWDPTTWGSGDAEWSLYGEDPTPIIGEEVTTIAPGPGGDFRSVDVTPVIFKDGHPSLMESWNSDKDWIENMQSVVGKVGTAVAPTPIERLVK